MESLGPYLSRWSACPSGTGGENVADVHEQHDLDVALSNLDVVRAAERERYRLGALRPAPARGVCDGKEGVPCIGLTVVERVRRFRLGLPRECSLSLTKRATLRAIWRGHRRPCRAAAEPFRRRVCASSRMMTLRSSTVSGTVPIPA